MKRRTTNLRTVLYSISAVILLTGAGSAILIYRAAAADPLDAGGYEVMGGYIYPGASESSKRYVHDLQLYGGNAAVLADDFMRWFHGLWYGKSLAYTVACIALMLSFGVFVAANNVHSGFPPDGPAGKAGVGPKT